MSRVVILLLGTRSSMKERPMETFETVAIRRQIRAKGGFGGLGSGENVA